jgi:hypothetical protein
VTGLSDPGRLVLDYAADGSNKLPD